MSSGIKSIWRNRCRNIATSRHYLPLPLPLTLPLSRPRGVRFIQSTSSFSTSHNFNSHEAVQDNDVPDTAAVEPATDEVVTALQSRAAEAVQTKHERNTFMRKAFRAKSPTIRKLVRRNLPSAYVPDAYRYPILEAGKSSRLISKKHARVQLGFDTIWKKFDRKIPKWTQTFKVLKRMTPKRSESNNMAALRVMLPSTWKFPVEKKRVEFVDATTGLTTKLRVKPGRKNPSTLVLRGESSALAKAADELVKACPDVQIFKLGDVTTCDSMTTRLWPPIDAACRDSSVPKGVKDRIWLHEEIQTHWIDRPYEQIPKPTSWTKESFETYITALVCGKLHSHLALKYYRQSRQNGKLIDTDGIRVRMIMNAFEDPSARKSITLPIFKMALAFMTKRGGYRASANRLFALAEEWHLPIDTDVFNIILDGYVSKRDATFFHWVLQRMEERYISPNARTWLLFLTLVQRDDARHQIISAMDEFGLFEDPATRRGIAQIMASHDSHAAFSDGKTLDQFMADQATRYGDDWFAGGAMHKIVKEFLRFHWADKAAIQSEAFQALMQRPFQDGSPPIDMRTSYVAILENCLEKKDWNTALWTVSHMQSPEHTCELDHHIYSRLISLAIITGAPSTLGVLIFYSLLARKLRQPARRPVQDILLRRLVSKHPVKIFSAKMAWMLRNSKVSSEATALAGVEWAILNSLDGYTPVQTLGNMLDKAWRTVDLPLLRRVQQQKEKKQQSTSPDDTRELPPLETPDLAIRLRDPTGQRLSQTVHLDTAFDPKTMIRHPSENALPSPISSAYSPQHEHKEQNTHASDES
ncbi:hypothetical protein E4U21_004048 [Claviceps maximensis]|nr:hypothetical protein E4U21_004048 [Claviceps maximensis]